MKNTISNSAKFTSAFTLIEVLVSVIILSGSIFYVLQIHSQNREQILYISERGTLALQDSLFLGEDVSAYNKDTKTAYEMVERNFRVDELKSRKILQDISREYNIPEPLKLDEGEEGMPTATVNEIKLKDQYSASYFHFKIDSF